MTISELKDAAGLTLVENWANGPLADAMQERLPKVETLTIESVYENKTCFRYMFRHRDAAGTERSVSLERGYLGSGWQWTAEGAVRPWENAARCAERAHAKRLDRALLFEYAAAFVFWSRDGMDT